MDTIIVPEKYPITAKPDELSPLNLTSITSCILHPSSPPVFSGVHVARSLVLYVCFVDRFVLFILAIVLSVLRFTDSDHPFGIFKLKSSQELVDLMNFSL